ncbi:MAG: hypothetical protein LAP38_07210 [Acidobacteriia bacterium]|nr:hypothetical protein [Terriglobia bacterium]
MRQVPLLAMFLAFGLGSCDRGPEAYPPPEQYQPLHGPDLPVLVAGVSNPDAWVLGDVHQETGAPGRRWTSAHPRFAFRLDRTEDLDLTIRLEVHSITFAHTGPVTVTIRVNGQTIDQLRFDSPDGREYSHPIPSALLQAQSPVVVAMDVDPVWVANDKQVFGIGLYYIGFREHAA